MPNDDSLNWSDEDDWQPSSLRLLSLHQKQKQAKQKQLTGFFSSNNTTVETVETISSSGAASSSSSSSSTTSAQKRKRKKPKPTSASSSSSGSKSNTSTKNSKSTTLPSTKFPSNLQNASSSLKEWSSTPHTQPKSGLFRSLSLGSATTSASTTSSQHQHRNGGGGDGKWTSPKRAKKRKLSDPFPSTFSKSTSEVLPLFEPDVEVDAEEDNGEGMGVAIQASLESSADAGSARDDTQDFVEDDDSVLVDMKYESCVDEEVGERQGEGGRAHPSCQDEEPSGILADVGNLGDGDDNERGVEMEVSKQHAFGAVDLEVCDDEEYAVGLWREDLDFADIDEIERQEKSKSHSAQPAAMDLKDIACDDVDDDFLIENPMGRAGDLGVKATAEESIVCPVCGSDLGGGSVESNERHVNRCLDALSDDPPLPPPPPPPQLRSPPPPHPHQITRKLTPSASTQVSITSFFGLHLSSSSPSNQHQQSKHTYTHTPLPTSNLQPTSYRSQHQQPQDDRVPRNDTITNTTSSFLSDAPVVENKSTGSGNDDVGSSWGGRLLGMVKGNLSSVFGGVGNDTGNHDLDYQGGDGNGNASFDGGVEVGGGGEGSHIEMRNDRLQLREVGERPRLQKWTASATVKPKKSSSASSSISSVSSALMDGAGETLVEEDARVGGGEEEEVVKGVETEKAEGEGKGAGKAKGKGKAKSGSGWSGSNGKKCPWYKHVPHTKFTVDAFCYGKVPHCEGYFLSHFHADHYMGLTPKFDHGPIYCSSVTANLVVQQLRVGEEKIVRLPMDVPVEVGGVWVRLIDANQLSI
ncbi:DNA cross-link repair 1A protein [Quaeritorhiza haematococci]|nr:DNA cross-link repair 1A protein [Quaeritorhiza haematococci]